jgi:hypothetical protein
VYTVTEVMRIFGGIHLEEFAHREITHTLLAVIKTDINLSWYCFYNSTS